MVWKFNIYMYIVHLVWLFLASGISIQWVYNVNQKLNTDTVKAIFSLVHNDINMQQGHDIGSAMYCYI